MFSDEFYDSLLDFSSDFPISEEYSFCDVWTANNPDAFPILNTVKRLLFYLRMASEILPKRRLYNGVKSIRSTSNTRERTLKENMAHENNWQNKTPDNWTNKDVLHWMCNQATDNNKNYEEIKLENFVNITSENLRDMSLQDFIRLTESSEDGELYYRSKEQLFKECNQINYHFNSGQHFEISHNQEPPQTYPENNRLTYTSTKPVNSDIPLRRRPGRPRSLNKIRKKPEQQLGKLWEFLRNLLLDNRTCPSLIKWENYNEGMFKFVESEKVAKLWGDRKKNTKMNYEKLSRAMRYYYKSEVLLPVAGRRLVYKFGPHASGWKTANPILDNPGLNI